jgi:hypothetical protein
MTDRPLNFYANVKHKPDETTTKVFAPTPEYGAGSSNKEFNKFTVRIREVREYDGTIYSRTAQTLEEAIADLDLESTMSWFSTQYKNPETISKEVAK